MKEYEVRQYQPGDEVGIVELLELVFDGWPKFDLDCSPLEHWRWKHLDNPLKTNIIVLGIFNGKIISCLHTIPRMLKIGNNVILSWERVDGAVHPDFRRMGLFNKMSELVYKSMLKYGVKIQYGATNNPILIEKYLKQGNPHLPNTLKHFIRIQDIDLHLRIIQIRNAWLKKYGFRFLKLYNRLRNALSSSPSSAQDFSISEIRCFDDRINTFWEEINNNYTFIVERKRSYLNWRYNDSHGGTYTKKIAEDDEKVLGYSVLRINRYNKNYPEGYIVDLITLWDRPDVVNRLVADAVNYFDSHNINIIHCKIIKNHPHGTNAKRFGFINSRFRSFIHFIPAVEINEELNKIQESTSNKINYVYGDFDLI